MKVYVIIYTHKHGMECAVYDSEVLAQRAAHHIMFERVESWDREDWKKFQGCETFDHQMDLFHQIEKNVSYGDQIELMERDVQGL